MRGPAVFFFPFAAFVPKSFLLLEMGDEEPGCFFLYFCGICGEKLSADRDGFFSFQLCLLFTYNHGAEHVNDFIDLYKKCFAFLL